LIAESFRNAGILPVREMAVGRSRRVRGRTAALIDVVMLACAFLAAYHLRVTWLGPLGGGARRLEYFILVELTAVAWLLVGAYLGLYAGKRLPFRKEATSLMTVAVLCALLLGAAAYLLNLEYLSRPVAVLFVAIAYAEMLAFRVVSRMPFLEAVPVRRRVIVVGSGPQAEKICRNVESSGAELVGLISEEPGAWVPYNRKRLGVIEETEAIFRREIVDEVIFAVPKAKLFEVESAFAAAEDFGFETKLSLDFLPHRFAKIDYEELGGMPMLSFSSAPAQPAKLAIKRAFDIAASGFAILVFAPLFAVIAAVIKLTSEGPVFFGQKRSGLNGRDFKVWKFRTMVPDAEKKLGELLKKNEMSGPSAVPGSVFKLKEDPRITPIGHFLRKTSLDELPQFWNVLIGDMSIVGPRPLFGVKQYDQRLHVRRLSVKPGITCTWQISGRNEVDFAEWMRMDLDYIDSWSLWTDLWICLATLPAVLFRKGAR
jgi:exopolysaccharide biosynthesis polyprenyl glycosylphosphotransferase